jgi:hypothetical protein
LERLRRDLGDEDRGGDRADAGRRAEQVFVLRDCGAGAHGVTDGAIECGDGVVEPGEVTFEAGGEVRVALLGTAGALLLMDRDELVASARESRASMASVLARLPVARAKWRACSGLTRA